MNQDKLYTQWTHQRREVSVPKDFSQRVMANIANQKPTARFTVFDDLGPRPSFLTRWAAAIGLIAMGVYRIVFVTANLLLGSTL